MPIEGLGNRGGIDVDLNGRLPPGENIRLELRGNFNDEHEPLRIHRGVDFRCRDFRTDLKVGGVRPSAMRRDRSE